MTLWLGCSVLNTLSKPGGSSARVYLVAVEYNMYILTCCARDGGIVKVGVGWVSSYSSAWL